MADENSDLTSAKKVREVGVPLEQPAVSVPEMVIPDNDAISNQPTPPPTGLSIAPAAPGTVPPPPPLPVNTAQICKKFADDSGENFKWEAGKAGAGILKHKDGELSLAISSNDVSANKEVSLDQMREMLKLAAELNPGKPLYIDNFTAAEKAHIEKIKGEVGSNINVNFGTQKPAEGAVPAVPPPNPAPPAQPAASTPEAQAAAAPATSVPPVRPSTQNPAVRAEVPTPQAAAPVPQTALDSFMAMKEKEPKIKPPGDSALYSKNSAHDRQLFKPLETTPLPKFPTLPETPTQVQARARAVSASPALNSKANAEAAQKVESRSPSPGGPP